MDIISKEYLKLITENKHTSDERDLTNSTELTNETASSIVNEGLGKAIGRIFSNKSAVRNKTIKNVLNAFNFNRYRKDRKNSSEFIY